jgi:hypothetical protein
MSKIRFEVPLSPSRYGELEQLSRQIGVSPRDLARLAIFQLLANQDALLGRRSGAASEAA